MNVTNTVLSDDYGRVARYLRLSVTDHCNFRCTYCRSGVEDNFIPHDSILRYEEMLTIVAASLRMGIQKIRLTGGEPFVRRGFINFVSELRQKFPQIDLRITTNATLVRPHVPTLRALGIRAINISLDSFDRDTFTRITGKDMLDEVLLTIQDLLAANIRVKINAVAMRGVSDVEMDKFISFARDNRVDVRFIEFMPMGSDTAWSENVYFPANEILEKAREFATLTPIDFSKLKPQARADKTERPKESKHQGPARMYSIEGGKGRFGIISAMSNHFCHSCNRLRVTSDGQLRTCLFADSEHSLRELLRDTTLCQNSSEKKRQLCLEEKICDVFKQAIKDKPLGEALLKARNASAVAQKKMVSIGG